MKRSGAGAAGARAFAALVLLVPGLLLTDGAHAWGPVGHRAVGAIADRLLDPAAQSAVADLLAEDLDREGRPSGRHSLAEIADWADEIRGGPKDHPRWHYDNRPVCKRDGGPVAWCPGGECASARLPEMLRVLGDGERPRAERNEALKWVVHLAGDLHQPLHAADFAEGGNRIRIAPRAHGRGESLHAFWDTGLVGLALHPQNGAISSTTLDRLVREARSEEPALVAAPPERWARESADLARSVALDLPGAACGDATGGTLEVRLPHAYVTRARHVAEERIALAGARLAYALNRVLGRTQP